MDRQRDRVDGTGDQVGSSAGGLEACGERVAGGALAVEAHPQTALFGESRRQLLGPLRLERARGVVDEDARGAQVWELPRLLDERLGLAGVARAVDEPSVELLPGRRDRLARLA